MTFLAVFFPNNSALTVQHLPSPLTCVPCSPTVTAWTEPVSDQ